ncbi:MAG: DUF1553 domain-containing protein, partial [Saprospiraceae bacterium]|nr:DUF1553 domain-containing protein [Saprospiraceae bacterium]
QYNFIDTSWNKAKSYGGKGYWGYPVEFIPEKNDQSARAALVAADPFSLALGRPTRENVTTKRSDEATLLQAMMLSNDELLAENIRRGADKWRHLPGTSQEKISELFLRLIGRSPENRELKVLSNVVADNKKESWEDAIWSMVMLPEFHLI